MKNFRITNGIGFGKTAKQKVEESFTHFGLNYSIIGGEISAYGNPDYVEIETDQEIDSDVMQSIAFNAKVTEF